LPQRYLLNIVQLFELNPFLALPYLFSFNKST
jgi:hypothetical protein